MGNFLSTMALFDKTSITQRKQKGLSVKHRAQQGHNVEQGMELEQYKKGDQPPDGGFSHGAAQICCTSVCICMCLLFI